MVDRLSTSQRSALMSSIRSTNTRPEMAIRRLLHRLGYRFRIHAAGLPGRPDIVFSPRRKCIFVHGCFWHQHRGCANATVPRTRPEYWSSKLLRNTERDASNEGALRNLGWEVFVLWECELKNPDLELRLDHFLGKPRIKRTPPKR